jgi:putative ABC transport system ATP-binding protein
MSLSKNVAVDCRGVTKSYGTGDARVTALRGVDLQVYTAELLMLVGPSGCGKTTLISIMGGVLDQDEGDCLVFDRDLKQLSQREKTLFRGRNIGFVFQEFHLLPTLTVTDNVAVPLLINGIGRGEAFARAKEALSRVGLGERTDSYPAELSVGQQQRVAIARAVVNSPKLVVCDEPTSALDHKTGVKVMELLREIALEADRALLIVTHDPRILQFSDRIAKMNDGRVEEIVNSAAEL